MDWLYLCAVQVTDSRTPQQGDGTRYMLDTHYCACSDLLVAPVVPLFMLPCIMPYTCAALPL